mgnify:CR=1 FL=1
MERMKMHSRDNVAAHIEAVGRLFPNALTEVLRDGKLVQAIDFDVLRQELSREIVEGREERYAFTWPDKRQAILAANAPINATLRPVVEDSVGRDGTAGAFDSENLYIEGDNLDVLKLLQETYLGKVKMIYIDIFIPSLIQSHIAQKARNCMVQAASGFLCFVIGSPVCCRHWNPCSRLSENEPPLRRGRGTIKMLEESLNCLRGNWKGSLHQ